MLYYLDEAPGGSWADFTLQKLGYDKDPSKLQLVLREVYRRATCRLALDDVPVVPVPLYEALDGKESADYVQRVEPSSRGGQKLAELLLDRLEPVLRAAAGGEGAPGGERPSAGGSAVAQPVSMPSPVHLSSKGS